MRSAGAARIDGHVGAARAQHAEHRRDRRRPSGAGRGRSASRSATPSWSRRPATRLGEIDRARVGELPAPGFDHGGTRAARAPAQSATHGAVRQSASRSSGSSSTIKSMLSMRATPRSSRSRATEKRSSMNVDQLEQRERRDHAARHQQRRVLERLRSSPGRKLERMKERSSLRIVRGATTPHLRSMESPNLCVPAGAVNRRCRLPPVGPQSLDERGHRLLDLLA